MSATLYYEPVKSFQDYVRSFAARQTITWTSWLHLLARFDALDELRWWIEDQFGALFNFWHSDTPDSLEMVLGGEMFLEYVSDWEKAHFVDFDHTLWRCFNCGDEICAWQAYNGRCPCCGKNGGLSYTGETFDGEEEETESKPQKWRFNSPILLTERRAGK